jgi:hypothetical protein
MTISKERYDNNCKAVGKPIEKATYECIKNHQHKMFREGAKERKLLEGFEDGSISKENWLKMGRENPMLYKEYQNAMRVISRGIDTGTLVLTQEQGERSYASMVALNESDTQLRKEGKL